MFRLAVAALMLAALVARPSLADVTGPATVVDGDTIVVAGERVRLQGIDAPEMHQTCTAYGYVGGDSINERLVREGWALDYRKYSTDYRPRQKPGAGAGIWRGKFTPPWEWRAARR